MRATAGRRGFLLATFVFTLAATPALAAPGQARLIAPAGDITGSAVVFSWAAVPSSTWYLLWFGTQSGSQFQKLVEE